MATTTPPSTGPLATSGKGRGTSLVLMIAVAAVSAAAFDCLRNHLNYSILPTVSSQISSILLTTVVGLVVCVGVFYFFSSKGFSILGIRTTPSTVVTFSDDDPKSEKDAEYDDGDDAFVVPPVKIKDSVYALEGGNDAPTPYVLTSDLAQQVAETVLPTQIADYTWIRVYSLSRDGDSFVTFLKAVENLDVTLLVLRTQKGSVLGAFADASWTKASTGPTKFHGGPKSRLFRVVGATADDSKRGRTTTKSLVECYKWTGANPYCQLCDVRRRRIAFGGGSSGRDVGSSFGLTLERDFLEGTTAPCPTFNNPPLCEETFAILELEVFGFRLW